MDEHTRAALVAWLARLRREHLERIHAASTEREAPTEDMA